MAGSGDYGKETSGSVKFEEISGLASEYGLCFIALFVNWLVGCMLRYLVCWLAGWLVEMQSNPVITTSVCSKSRL
jgi:ACR3 family arsenite efflux pump ArsB